MRDPDLCRDSCWRGDLRSRLRLAGLQRMGALLAGLGPSDRDDLRALQRRIRQAPGLIAWGGLFQRVSTATGFGCLTALSMRARCMLASPRLIDAAGGVPRFRLEFRARQDALLCSQDPGSASQPGAVGVQGYRGRAWCDDRRRRRQQWAELDPPGRAGAIHAPPDGASRSTSTTSCVISMARCSAKGASCTCLSSGAPGCLESRPSR